MYFVFVCWHFCICLMKIFYSIELHLLVLPYMCCCCYMNEIHVTFYILWFSWSTPMHWWLSSRVLPPPPPSPPLPCGTGGSDGLKSVGTFGQIVSNLAANTLLLLYHSRYNSGNICALIFGATSWFEMPPCCNINVYEFLLESFLVNDNVYGLSLFRLYSVFFFAFNR